MNTLYKIINKNNNLWNKIKYSKVENVLDTKILKNNSKNHRNLLENKFALADSKLFFLKNNFFKGFINLNYIGMDYNNFEMKIVLFTQNKFFSFYFKKIFEFKFWKKIIMEKCIMNNFQKRYDVLSKIGQICDSKFYIIRKKNNNNKYFLRVFSKKELNCTEKVFNFIKEIEKIKKLNFCNTLKFYQLYESNGSFYIVFKTNIFKKINNFNLSYEAKKNYVDKVSDEFIGFYNYIFNNDKLFLQLIQNRKPYSINFFGNNNDYHNTEYLKQKIFYTLTNKLESKFFFYFKMFDLHNKTSEFKIKILCQIKNRKVNFVFFNKRKQISLNKI